MLFNSLEFLFFLPLFFALWPLLRTRDATRWAYLTVASFFFYGWWDWRYLGLLAGTGLIDFLAALGMATWPRRRKLLLVVSMTANISSLAFFKYLDFLVANLNDLLHATGSNTQFPLHHLILPVGISFYTFQSMSYTIGVYRRQFEPTHNVLHFFASLSLFPHLVAGPIVRAGDLLPQLRSAPPPTPTQRWDGLVLIVQGYFKKVVVADGLAPIVNAAFADAAPSHSTLFWWLVMAMFAVQIYGDFSGYTDIARGLAKQMGYEFMLNFNHPYAATSLRDFWTRWHISLSTWFRDYLYVPLGGSRGGEARAHRNLWITMLTSALWHGAAWTFILWGVIHAAFLSLERLTDWPRKLARLPGGRHVAMLIVFALVVIAWVFFRATSVAQAMLILTAMVHAAPMDAQASNLLGGTWPLFLMFLMLTRQFAIGMKRDESAPRPRGWRPALQPAVLALMIWACVFLRGPGSAFIYFQF